MGSGRGAKGEQGMVWLLHSSLVQGYARQNFCVFVFVFGRACSPPLKQDWGFIERWAAQCSHGDHGNTRLVVVVVRAQSIHSFAGFVLGTSLQVPNTHPDNGQSHFKNIYFDSKTLATKTLRFIFNYVRESLVLLSEFLLLLFSWMWNWTYYRTVFMNTTVTTLEKICFIECTLLLHFAQFCLSLEKLNVKGKKDSPVSSVALIILSFLPLGQLHFSYVLFYDINVNMVSTVKYSDKVLK